MGVLRFLRFGILSLGTSLSFLAGCTGEAFTSFDEVGTVDAGTDTGSDAAQALDGGTDAQDASNDVEADALDDAATDATVDADAGEPDDGGTDGDVVVDDAGDGGDTSDGGEENDGGDAATDAADDGCVPVTYYFDQDNDGFGVDSNTLEACAPPGKNWATQKGDCHDENPDVHPGQTAYFTQPYTKPGVVAELSFDYDCSGAEENEAKPTSSQANCQAPSLGSCTGTGYLKVNPARPEANANQFCGSTTYRTCTPILNLVACEPPSTNSSATPLGCR